MGTFTSDFYKSIYSVIMTNHKLFVMACECWLWSWYNKFSLLNMFVFSLPIPTTVAPMFPMWPTTVAEAAVLAAEGPVPPIPRRVRPSNRAWSCTLARGSWRPPRRVMHTSQHRQILLPAVPQSPTPALTLTLRRIIPTRCSWTYRNK